jgi:glyoxylase-like metal-dependent hydrolase (beta-lactamase superfamily II)
VPAKPDSKLIDVRQLDRERVIGAWDLGGAIVDPGPESRIETLLEAVSEEPRALLLTHIHLDHAGAAGALVERFPELEVWVHAKGAPHLVDPTRLLASAARIYRDRLVPLWGRVIPVPERNLRVLDGGETIHVAGRDLAVEYTPGHASHHVVYFDQSDGTAYVGDVAGVRIPPKDHTVAPTPPPDIDVETWARSVDTVAEWQPERLCLTHFGYADDPQAQLGRLLEALARQLEYAQLGDLESFQEALAAARPPDIDPQLVQAAPPDQLYLGLERYLRKRAEAAA